MFQPFAWANETHRIELPDAQWVDIRARMSQFDEDRYQSGLIKYQAKIDKIISGQSVGEATDVEFLLPQINLLLLQINVVDWSFEDPDGKKYPIDTEHLERLTSDVTGPVLEAVMERNPKLFGRVEGQKKKTKSTPSS